MGINHYAKRGIHKLTVRAVISAVEVQQAPGGGHPVPAAWRRHRAAAGRGAQGPGELGQVEAAEVVQEPCSPQRPAGAGCEPGGGGLPPFRTAVLRVQVCRVPAPALVPGRGPRSASPACVAFRALCAFPRC